MNEDGTTGAAGNGGFTLVEVLVALAIVATALISGLQATSALSSNADRQTQLMLAQICAQNQLIELRLSRRLPGVGRSSRTCRQGGRELRLEQSVNATPNPNFRRVEVHVLDGPHSVVRLTTIAGRN